MADRILSFSKEMLLGPVHVVIGDTSCPAENFQVSFAAPVLSMVLGEMALGRHLFSSLWTM